MVEFVPQFMSDLAGVVLSFQSLEQGARVEQGFVSTGHLRPPNVFQANHARKYTICGFWSDGWQAISYYFAQWLN
jgi:hypothetical protein